MTEIIVNRKWCKGCGICAAFCPKRVLAIRDEKAAVVNGDACNGCMMCELRCADLAIRVVKEGIK